MAARTRASLLFPKLCGWEEGKRRSSSRRWAKLWLQLGWTTVLSSKQRGVTNREEMFRYRRASAQDQNLLSGTLLKPLKKKNEIP